MFLDRVFAWEQLVTVVTLCDVVLGVFLADVVLNVLVTTKHLVTEEAVQFETHVLGLLLDVGKLQLARLALM